MLKLALDPTASELQNGAERFQTLARLVDRFGGRSRFFTQQSNDATDILPCDSRDSRQECFPKFKPERHVSFPSARTMERIVGTIKRRWRETADSCARNCGRAGARPSFGGCQAWIVGAAIISFFYATESRYLP